jgi:hypothetical protein
MVYDTDDATRHKDYIAVFRGHLIFFFHITLR